MCPTCDLLPYFDILGERFLLWTSRNVWSNIRADSLCQFYGSPQILCLARSSVVTKCQTGQPKEVSNKCQWVSRPPILWIALIGSKHVLAYPELPRDQICQNREIGGGSEVIPQVGGGRSPCFPTSPPTNPALSFHSNAVIFFNFVPYGLQLASLESWNFGIT